MKKKERIIQYTLIFTGIFLIIATYFLYPKIKGPKIEKEVVKRETTVDTINTFENVEYSGFYDSDKPFMVKSKKAYIENENPEIVYMTNMLVTLHMSDGRIITITSDEGRYNKITYDCFFEQNVKATDEKIILTSDNLDLLSSNNTAAIYNNVYLQSNEGTLTADRVDYDFETQYYKISMFNNEKIKVKVIR